MFVNNVLWSSFSKEMVPERRRALDREATRALSFTLVTATN